MAARLSRCSLGNDGVLKRVRNYCGLIKIARSGFPCEKTAKRPSGFGLHQLRNRCIRLEGLQRDDLYLSGRVAWINGHNNAITFVGVFRF